MSPNGGRLSLENGLKSDSSVICLISLKSGDLMKITKISQFP